MDNSLNLAVQHKRVHREESYKDVAYACKILISTPYSRTHLELLLLFTKNPSQNVNHAAAAPRRLSIEQEK